MFLGSNIVSRSDERPMSVRWIPRVLQVSQNLEAASLLRQVALGTNPYRRLFRKIRFLEEIVSGECRGFKVFT